jgi:hypothetical protein
LALSNTIVDYVLRIVVLTEKPPCERGMEKGDRKGSDDPVIASGSEAIQRFPFWIATGPKPLAMTAYPPGRPFFDKRPAWPYLTSNKGSF